MCWYCVATNRGVTLVTSTLVVYAGRLMSAPDLIRMSTMVVKLLYDAHNSGDQPNQSGLSTLAPALIKICTTWILFSNVAIHNAGVPLLI